MIEEFERLLLADGQTYEHGSMAPGVEHLFSCGCRTVRMWRDLYVMPCRSAGHIEFSKRSAGGAA